MSDQETQQPAGGDDSGQKSTRQTERGGARDRHRGRRRHTSGAANRPLENSLNMDELRELMELIDEHGFTDFELENKDIRVRLRRELAPQIVSSAQGSQPSASGSTQTHADVSVSQLSSALSGTSSRATAPATTSSPAEAQTETGGAAAEDDNLLPIPSPIVGTFYRSPSPTAEPFVRLGSHVHPDTTVCIIEAMKLMNEIQAETSGVIAKIYVENGQPVEYGQPLFGIKK
jgi:acetyl-CoA carboxylase biotin carboxyl carrier protein